MGSSTPLFAEANWAWGMPSPYDLPPATLNGGFTGLQRALINRHDKRVNVVYADGHVDSVRLPALYQQEWYPEFKLMPGVTPPQMPGN